MRNIPSHIFDLKVKDDWILYSDWLEHSIFGVSMVTGQQEVLVRGLMRPTVFVLSNERDKGNEIMTLAAYPCKNSVQTDDNHMESYKWSGSKIHTAIFTEKTPAKAQPEE